VPVPLHPSRLAERGYNQSSLLARRVARHLGAPFAPLALARARDTPKQATLDREARLANVAGAFRVREPTRVYGRAVLLVDDVSTTGATLAACAQALQAAGASAVATAVLARAGLFPAAEVSSL
jgi:ComF family protein